jgi:hypothetical protein
VSEQLLHRLDAATLSDQARSELAPAAMAGAIVQARGAVQRGDVRLQAVAGEVGFNLSADQRAALGLQLEPGPP